MKYFVTATPGPLPPSPEQFDAAFGWLEAKLEDGTFDCLYGFLEGGGFSVTNADSHLDALGLMTGYPLFGLVTWDVRPVLDFKEGADTIRAKLVEARQAMGGGG
ncbi:MAG TPA: hypothetical protein VHZ54_13630 [Solirubrobacterales bacterium]|jgi:hypothetical protein|nr:hypothetical protein [Solirubrobacterales bacterium]